MTNMLKKVFNWSEVHLYKVNSYKVHTLNSMLLMHVHYMYLVPALWKLCVSTLKKLAKRNQKYQSQNFPMKQKSFKN
jgi:hypothetical protein